MVEFYIDEKGEHRWRAVAKNGRIVAESGEGYKRKCDATKGVRSAFNILNSCVWNLVCASAKEREAKKGK